jgi:glycogen debranching enzyme
MSIDRWTNPANRTIQYVAASTPEHEAFNRILLMIHGSESPIDVTLPLIAGVTRYVPLWSSIDERPVADSDALAPGDVVPLPSTSMRLFRAE